MVIGNLNINSISNIFDNLKLVIQRKVGILVITETKTDSALLLNQFAVPGYSKHYRFDRNRNGGGIFINTRENISSKELIIHNTSEDIERIFFENNLIKTKCLLCGYYHPPSQSNQYFFKSIRIKLDKYSKHYDKFRIRGMSFTIPF